MVNHVELMCLEKFSGVEMFVDMLHRSFTSHKLINTAAEYQKVAFSTDWPKDCVMFTGKPRAVGRFGFEFQISLNDIKLQFQTSVNVCEVLFPL